MWNCHSFLQQEHYMMRTNVFYKKWSFTGMKTNVNMYILCLQYISLFLLENKNQYLSSLITAFSTRTLYDGYWFLDLCIVSTKYFMCSKICFQSTMYSLGVFQTLEHIVHCIAEGSFLFTWKLHVIHLHK